jgi:hypothetical protein
MRTSGGGGRAHSWAARASTACRAPLDCSA